MYLRGLAWFNQFAIFILCQWFRLTNCSPIVGGKVVQKTEISRYSYIVSLQDRYQLGNATVTFKHFCGGSLVSSSWILTAGHCVYHKKESEIVAAIGYVDLGVDSLEYRDIDAIKVIKFIPSSLKNDIALVRLKASVMLGDDRSLGLVPIPGMKASRKKPCQIVGYGADKYGGKIQSKLNEGEVYVISRTKCTRILGKIMAPQEGDLAVCGLGDSQDSCQGDSGGPLICPVGGKDYIFGIVSHGLTCGQPGVPSIYTVTIPYKQWIDSIINNNNKA